MALSFAPAVEDVPTINVVLLGPPKTGKTMGAASAPGPVLYLNADLPTATRYARRYYGEKVQEVRFEGMQTLIDITHAAYDPEKPWGTVVIDTIGELYRLIIEDASKRAVRPTLNQYGDTSVYLERFCRSLCEAPVNAVFICHDHPVQDEAAGETLVMPFTGTSNPKLGRKLLGMVDVIGYTGAIFGEDGGREWVAQLTNNKGRPGGGRFDVLPGETGFRRLDLSEWIDAIHAAEADLPTGSPGEGASGTPQAQTAPSPTSDDNNNDDAKETK